MSITMPNPITNQTERNIAEDNNQKCKEPFQVKQEKGNDIKDKIKDIRTLFESDEEDYYEPVRISNPSDDNFIKYESNGDKDKTLSIE